MADLNETRRIRRRALITLIGGTAAASLTAAPALAASACALSPRQSEGPYFLDTRLHRSDIRFDSATGDRSAGMPLRLQLRVVQADALCAPLQGVAVEIWHCDARGIYSGVRDPRGASAGDFLRGFQVTDSEGAVSFTTVYPGWYPGRAVHIHVKLRRPQAAAGGRISEWTSQLYFDDRATLRAHRHIAYSHGQGRAPKNEDDFLFRNGGRDLMLDLAEADEGYSARFDLAVRLS